VKLNHVKGLLEGVEELDVSVEIWKDGSKGHNHRSGKEGDEGETEEGTGAGNN